MRQSAIAYAMCKRAGEFSHDFHLLISLDKNQKMIYMYIIEVITMLAIRISHDIETRLQRLAQKTGRTKTYYAREALLRFIEDMEDEYIALSRIETPTKRWTLEELEQGIDLEG